MNKSLIVAGIATALVLAGCAGTQTAAPETVTAVSTVTVTSVTTVTATPEAAATTEVAAVTSRSSTDEAACRLIAPAIEQSGLQHLADQQSVGGNVMYGDVVTAGRDFVGMLGAAPTSASDSITGPLLALATSLSVLEQNWTALPKDADKDAINSALASFPQSVAALDDACATD